MEIGEVDTWAVHLFNQKDKTKRKKIMQALDLKTKATLQRLWQMSMHHPSIEVITDRDPVLFS
jgi:hypothetical protein